MFQCGQKQPHQLSDRIRYRWRTSIYDVESGVTGSDNLNVRFGMAGSTDLCNTFCELFSRRLIEQGLSRPFIELPCDGTELGLTVQGQIGATRKILAQQSVGVFF